MASKKLTMKLLIDTKSQKVLAAEAGNDVVDFLFSLLALPVASIVKLLTADHMVGCIGNLYHCVKSLDKSYIQPSLNKSDLLNPVQSSPPFGPHNTLLLPAPTSARNYYRCSGNYSHSYITDVSGALCPSCRSLMTSQVAHVEGNTEGVGGGGFVKEVVTYTIMDDLTVTPMSTISSITMLNKLQVKDMSVLQEKPVELGFEQGLELLKASLQSKTVLTHVFLRGNFKPLILSLAWHIWKSRNRAHFELQLELPQFTWSQACSEVREFAAAGMSSTILSSRTGRLTDYKLIRWEPPDPGRVKLNFDGSFFLQSSRGGAGFVIRDHQGVVILAGAEAFECNSAQEAELRALWYGLCLILARWPSAPICIEGDSQETIARVTSSSPADALVQDCQSMLHCLGDPCITHIFREGNTVADGLAGIACRSRHEISPDEVLPPEVQVLVQIDRGGHQRVRGGGGNVL